jgi:hypothetical protein
MAAAKTIPLERSDPMLWSEIKEAKEELSNLGYVYLDLDGKGFCYERPFCLVPEIKKCYHCGKIITATMTNGCNHRTAISK